MCESTLLTLDNHISKALIDNEISDDEFSFILEENEKYLKLKEDKRLQSKEVDKLMQIETDKILKKGREQGKNEMIQKIQKGIVLN